MKIDDIYLSKLIYNTELFQMYGKLGQVGSSNETKFLQLRHYSTILARPSLTHISGRAANLLHAGSTSTLRIMPNFYRNHTQYWQNKIYIYLYPISHKSKVLQLHEAPNWKVHLVSYVWLDLQLLTGIDLFKYFENIWPNFECLVLTC